MGIRRKYFLIVCTLLILITIGAITIGSYVLRTQSSVYKERSIINEKAKAVDELEDTLIQVLFRAGGYYAFQDSYELEKLYTNLDELKVKIDDFKDMVQTEQEITLQKDLEEFYYHYVNDLLPLAISYVKTNNYQGLRDLSSGGASATVNEFLDYTQNFRTEAEKKRDEIYEEAFNKYNQFNIMITSFAVLSIFMLIFLIGRILKSLIVPIEELSMASQSISKGKKFQLTANNNRDEIGVLARSFEEMAINVQNKEEELMAQNEELISQQSELQEQQEKLQHYITEIDSIKKALDQSAIVCITDENGVITNVNEKFCHVTQYKKRRSYW